MMARVIALMVGASYTLAVGWAFLFPQGFYSTIAPFTPPALSGGPPAVRTPKCRGRLPARSAPGPRAQSPEHLHREP
jgi:hypothetical protein